MFAENPVKLLSSYRTKFKMITKIEIKPIILFNK
ncbi:hypothetical protein GGQ57_001640 [Parabacteroides faecis]|jgi:hypothetical protein|uniref:Transposase n=1 Tax=Parabacteroides faecis TaxID=1217282 RepID=A0ABR6KK86_9BACT|nr:hypothetical protein [Parabacteroides faecis]